MLEKATSLFALTAIALLCSAGAPAASAGQETRTAHLVIDGMVTPNCPVLVKTALRRLDGVRSVDASLETKRVDVEYLAEGTTPEQILAVIKDQVGFDAKLVREAEFKIEGMATPNCPVLVEAAVSRMAGVLSVDAELATMSVAVAFVEGQTTPEEIIATIRDKVGFTATYTGTR